MLPALSAPVPQPVHLPVFGRMANPNIPAPADMVTFSGSAFPGRKVGLTLSPARVKDIPEMIEFISDIEEKEYGKERPSADTIKSIASWYKTAITGPRGYTHNGKHYSAPASRIYLVRDAQGRLVGTSGLHQFSAVPEKAQLYSNYLAPEYRGLGIGEWLLKQRIVRAKKFGVETLGMDAHPVSVILASKHGFVVDVEEAEEVRSHQKKHSPDDLKILPDTVPMKLDLTA